MKILVTGFEPFGNESINPSTETVRRLPDSIDKHHIIKMEIPTVAHLSLKILEEAIQTYKPDIILCIGQAGGRPDITVERIGINCDDFRIPDNAGNQPSDEPIFADGPAAYFSTLPVKAMVAAIQHAGISASISNSAGTYVCNHVLYGVSYLCDHYYPDTRNGFIHVPYLPEQTLGKENTPYMTLEDIITGLVAAIKVL